MSREEMKTNFDFSTSALSNRMRHSQGKLVRLPVSNFF
ncbi:hypothetical protein ABH991_001681 [Bradyrhizobium ottawaense]